MGKSDQLLLDRGSSIRDSASQRALPAALPTHSAAVLPADLRMQDVIRSKNTFEIPVARIEADPDQPRRTFDDEELGRLAENIRANGLLHPPGVRWMPDLGVYRILYGERRWRAAKRLGWASIGCKRWDEPLTPAEIRIIQGSENLSRSEVRPIEQARSFAILLEAGMSRREIAERHGVSQGLISQALALVGMPEEIQDEVAGGRLPASTAYRIGAKIADPEGQREAAREIIDGGLSRADAVRLVESRARGPRAAGAGGRKGRAAGLPTARTFRTAPGIRITAERGRGVDPVALVEALRDALGQAEAEVRASGAAGPGGDPA